MTAAEIESLSLKVSQKALRTWNGGHGFNDPFFKDKSQNGLKIVKEVSKFLEKELLGKNNDAK